MSPIAGALTVGILVMLAVIAPFATYFIARAFVVDLRARQRRRRAERERQRLEREGGRRGRWP